MAGHPPSRSPSCLPQWSTSGWSGLGPTTAAAPWPGSLPAPAPATLATEVVGAEVVDHAAATVRVSGRGTMSGDPARLRVGDGRWVDVAAWAGPWPVEERWWDPSRQRRRARLQVLDDTGVARLLTLESGHWHVEAVYD